MWLVLLVSPRAHLFPFSNRPSRTDAGLYRNVPGFRTGVARVSHLNDLRARACAADGRPQPSRRGNTGFRSSGFGAQESQWARPCIDDGFFVG